MTVLDNQSELNRAAEWCSLNNLDLITSNCKVVSFSRKVNPILFDYKINSDVLKRVSIVKDLGIYFTTQTF